MIPVVADPIDVVNDITTPLIVGDEIEWWKVVFALIMVVLLIVLLAPVWPYILQAILYVYDYIAKGVRAVSKLLKKRKDDKESKEE